jgi:hypothetical protein
MYRHLEKLEIFEIWEKVILGSYMYDCIKCICIKEMNDEVFDEDINKIAIMIQVREIIIENDE